MPEDPEYDVYGIGHALVDLQFRVDEARLRSLGIDKGVMTLVDAARRRRVLDGLDPGALVHRASGGSAANTVITVARFGGSAYYAFQVGRDDWGRFYRDDLQTAGVDSSPTACAAGETGQCLVLVTPDADRTMNTFLGASGVMGPHQVDPRRVGSSRFAYLEGYLLTTEAGLQACQTAASAARKLGVPVALTLSDPAVVDAFGTRFEQVVGGGVDLLVCNHDEALAFTGADDEDAAARALAGRAQRVCVTLGADGVLVADRGLPRRVAGFETRAVDTTGAGDTFAGGLLYGLTHGFGIDEAATLGNYAAAVVVSAFGPRPPVGLDELVDDILARRAPVPARLVDAREETLP